MALDPRILKISKKGNATFVTVDRVTYRAPEDTDFTPGEEAFVVPRGTPTSKVELFPTTVLGADGEVNAKKIRRGKGEIWRRSRAA